MSICLVEASWLPLYGNLCCQLVAQPDCMTQDVMSGYLSQQVSRTPLCVSNLYKFNVSPTDVCNKFDIIKFVFLAKH